MIRSLRPGESIPDGPPRRYYDVYGYVRLRWHVGVQNYVETFEHRVVDGAVTTAEEVHHINRVRDDNRPENLEYLTAAEHKQRHTADHDQIVELYRQGLSTIAVGERVGMSAGWVSRVLAEHQVEARSNSSYYPEINLDLLRALHARGMRMGPMAQRLGVGHRRVRAALIDLDLALPGPGRPRVYDDEIGDAS